MGQFEFHLFAKLEQTKQRTRLPRDKNWNGVDTDSYRGKRFEFSVS
jgi:hypothetical protein